MKDAAVTARAEALVARLRAEAKPENREGMARFGINTSQALGISIPILRTLAKPHRRDHTLAQALWETGLHEARILASLIGDPKAVTVAEMDDWVAAFDSWDLCDQTAANLFAFSPHATAAIPRYVADDREFVRRAGFVLMAARAVRVKSAGDAEFRDYLPLIERHAQDDRNFVKKAVNWALRQIGKSRPALMEECLALAEKLAAASDRTARWIGHDAARELRAKRDAKTPTKSGA